MPNFVTTLEILSNPWSESFKEIDTNNLELPSRKEWLYDNTLTIEQVNLWEKIYYEPGVIVVQAAWDPYAEFYIITHNLHLQDLQFVETFYGKNAEHCLELALKKFGISLPKNQIWVDHLTCAMQQKLKTEC